MEFCPVCMLRGVLAKKGSLLRNDLKRANVGGGNGLSIMNLSRTKMGNRSSWVVVRWGSLTRRSMSICDAR